MNQVTELEFDNSIRSLRNIRIVSSVVGHARITSYKQGTKVLGLVRSYKGIKYFYKNVF